jgi:hypothetical protein
MTASKCHMQHLLQHRPLAACALSIGKIRRHHPLMAFVLCHRVQGTQVLGPASLSDRGAVLVAYVHSGHVPIQTRQAQPCSLTCPVRIVQSLKMT